jgi:beta-lactam-binding protein with PASTA domain
VVPNVKSKSLKAAKAAIKAHGCRVGTIKHSFSKEVKKGHVISERPRPHKRLVLHAKVNLVVSRGRHP